VSGRNAFGTEFRRGNGATPTETFTTIANVTNIGGPARSRETIDVTTHGSPDAWMEFIGGLKNGGEVSLDINYDPAEATHDLDDDFDDDDLDDDFDDDDLDDEEFDDELDDEEFDDEFDDDEDDEDDDEEDEEDEEDDGEPA
jgi:predicted secreted protein